MTDPIADMLTRIRNAIAARHSRVDIPASKLKLEIARILKEEGYLESYELVDSKVEGFKVLQLKLKYIGERRHRRVLDQRAAAHGETRLGVRSNAQRRAAPAHPDGVRDVVPGRGRRFTDSLRRAPHHAPRLGR